MRRLLRLTFTPSFCRVSRFVFALFFCIATIQFSIAQSTNIAIGTTVKRSDAKRLGINLGGQNYYDSGQMLRNLIFRNPGFEGESWQSVLKCSAVTATSCTDANPWNVWPKNFLQGASYEVINGSASGETGTISTSTVSAFGAGNTTNPNYGMTINFSAPAKPLAVGDYVIVRMQVPGNAQAGWWTSTSGGATLLTDLTDIASDSPGKQALEIKAATSGQSATVDSYFDSSSGRSFVQLKGTYTLAFKAKGLGGSNQVNVTVTRIGTSHGNEVLLSQAVTLTGSWKDYSYNFNASEDGTYIGPVQVQFSIAGAHIYLDDASLMAPAEASNPTAYRNEVVDTLKALKPGVIRYMTGTDFGASTANIVAPPFARQRAGINSQASEEDDVPAGLEEFLVLCQAVGAEPWYTMAGEATPTDMKNLIDFLAGDASTTYGAKRIALGQTAPWTTVFSSIHLELGNEMWNGGMAGEAISDPVVYGKRAGAIFTAARSTASYDASKFDLIMGSFAVNSWWTQQEMANSSGYDSVDAAPYLFNTLSAYSTNELIFGPMFAQPEQIDSNASGYMAQQAAAAGTGTKLAVYEVNLSTLSGTAPQSVVTGVAGGEGAGIAVADHMLLMMRDLGVTTQNMFALTEYGNGYTNSGGGSETVPLWGAVVDMGGQTNVKRPQFLAEQLANQAILPTMLATTVTGANPTWNQAQSANDTSTPIQLANAHYLQSFAFTDGTNKSVVVFNLSRSGSLPVTFSGVNAPTGDVLIRQLKSTSPMANNENLTSASPIVSATQTNVASFNPAAAYSLPPYSMTVFLWPGAALPASTTALEASPNSAVVGQTVTLTATVASESGVDTPTGQVTFLKGLVSLGTKTLNSSGEASLSTSSLASGSDLITAVYSGDTDDAGSTSPVVPVTIKAAGTTTTLTTSAIAVAAGQSVTLTAKVIPASGSVPTGTVKFLSGTTSLGTATLSSGGSAALSTTALGTGTDSITASYAGSSTDAASVSETVDVTVAGNSSTIGFGSGFTSAASELQLNGSTALNGSLLELTNGGKKQAGSAFFKSAVNIQAFTTDFFFEQSSPSGDGMTFTIQNTGKTAIGGNGGGLGYLGIRKSVAIKFDLFNNAGEGSDSTGIYLGGALPTVPSVSLSSSPINLHSGHLMQAHVTYDGKYLTLSLFDRVTQGRWSRVFAINIPSAVGGTTAYLGFTGGTGTLTSIQKILSWTYEAGMPVLPNYPTGFYDASQLTLNGGAALSGTSLKLTNSSTNQATSVYFSTPVNIQAFVNDFYFTLKPAAGDGFTMVIQNAGLGVVGGLSGGGLGYEGVGKSVAIKFDIYNNDGEGNDSTGVYSDGSLPTMPSTSLTSSGVKLNSGDLIHAHVTYSGDTLAWTLTDVTLASRPTFTHSVAINIPGKVGADTAYVGFTAASGIATATQKIVAWNFISQ